MCLKSSFYPILLDKGYRSYHSMTEDQKQDTYFLIQWNSNKRPSYIALADFKQPGQYLTLGKKARSESKYFESCP